MKEARDSGKHTASPAGKIRPFAPAGKTKVRQLTGQSTEASRPGQPNYPKKPRPNTGQQVALLSEYLSSTTIGA